MILESIKSYIEEAKRKNLEKLEKINNYISSINDSIVKNSSFQPLKWWWSNFKTHKLIIDTYWNIIFKVWTLFPTIFVWIFSIPIVITLIIFFSYIISNFNNLNTTELINYVFPILLFSSFSIPIGIIFYFLFVSKIFDFQNWYYYNLRYQKNIYSLLNNEKYKNKIIAINQIHALQIIKERVQSKNSSYYSYELNLILKDSNRMNVIDHGNLETIRQNAEQLANRLWVKIWDITTIDQ